MIKRISGMRKEYSGKPAYDVSLHADPLRQFLEWFNDAVKSGIEEPNAMVLSTADLQGNVSARVVLLKGIESGGFVFFSNYLSHKGNQLKSNPKAALTFLWKSMDRQVRVEGRVSKIKRRDSVEYFNSRPIDSRVSACISPQSAVIPDRAFLEAMREGFILDLQGSEPLCPPHWGGYIVKPKMIEFWQGREYRLHDRLRYRIEKNQWVTERLAP